MDREFSKVLVLKRLSVQRNTLNSYRKHFELFWKFVKEKKIERTGKEDLDQMVSLYCDHVYLKNLPKSYASTALAALEWRYSVKLPQSRKAVKCLMKLLPPKKKPAMPWRVCLYLVCMSLFDGEWDFAFATLVMFAGFLRIGEMAQLKFSDVDCR